MKKLIVYILSSICFFYININAQKKYLDFEIGLNSEKILHVSNLYDISYMKCIAYYDENLIKSDIAYFLDLDVLNMRNPKIYNSIKKIDTACILFQLNEKGIRYEERFDLFSNVSLDGIPFRERPYLVECDVMIITFYKDDKSFKYGFITSIKKIGT